MSEVSDIEAAIAQLPAAERGRLASKIIRDLEEDLPEVTPEWVAEIERRSREIESGKVTPLSLDEFRARIAVPE